LTFAMRLLFSAGETSGDLHGSRLLEQIATRARGVEAFGLGGPRMERAGLLRLARAEDLDVVGIFEVARRLPAVWRCYRALLAGVRERRPAAAVLIDYPDFNLLLARRLSRMAVPVIYYVSPQVWAWRPGRVKVMARTVRRMITLFPFEQDIYRSAGLDVVCAGHPLVDEVARALASQPAPPPPAGRGRLVLMPGSRPGEIARHWPVLREAALRLGREFPLESIVVRPSHVDAARYSGAAESGIAVFSGSHYGLLSTASLLLVASGTSTLEGALCGTPMVVIYKTSSATFALARRLVRIPNVALANIVAGERVVPELLQEEATAENIVREAREILASPGRRDAIRLGLARAAAALGPGGASGRAADAVLEAAGAGR
jgi:lipid-A-disaccharide synthase